MDIMCFTMRASTNSLTTPHNLARGGKVVDASCKLCCVPDQATRTTATLGHIVNNCPKMLDRYGWRHNGVVAYIYGTLMEIKPEGMKVYADVESAKLMGELFQPK